MIGNAKTKLHFPTRYACPICNKKMMNYADHPHAFGWKEYDKVFCRGCQTTFWSKQLSEWIAEHENALINDGRWPQEVLLKKSKKEAES